MLELTPEHINPQVNWASDRSVDAGWSRRSFQDQDLRLVVVLCGKLAVERSDGQYGIPAGHLQIAEPNDSGTLYTAVEDTVYCSVYLDLMAGLSWGKGEYHFHPAFPTVTDLGVHADYIAGLMRAVIHVFQERPPHMHQQLRGIVSAMFICLADLWEDDSAGGRSSPRIHAMKAYMREHLHRPLCRQDLATVFHLSPDYVNQVFKRACGCSVGDWIQRERCRIAQRLLHCSDESIAEIARQVGYVDACYFSRIYKKQMGQSPRDCQQSHAVMRS